MRYRGATTADALTLAQLNRQLIRDEWHRNPMSEEELQVRMANWLAGEYQAVLFEGADGPAGYAPFRVEDDHVYLRQFFVRPDRRRQGVGRAAINWLLDNVWRNAPRVRLDVLIGNAHAIQFWRAVGFADYCLTMERSGGSLGDHQ